MPNSTHNDTLLREARLNSCMARIAKLRAYALECPDCRVRRQAFDCAWEAEYALQSDNFDEAGRWCVEGELAIVAESEARR